MIIDTPCMPPITGFLHRQGRKLIHLAFIVFGLAGFPAIASAEESLTFAMTSAESSQAVEKIWPAFMEEMSKAIGRKVVILPHNDYAGAVWSLSENRAQIGFLGNRAAIEAIDRADCEIAVQTTDRDGAPGYYSLLIVHQRSDLASAADMVRRANGLSFNFGDRNSTSGFTVPNFYLFLSQGLDAQSIFKHLRYADHETNLMAVAAGQVDVATNNTESLSLFRQQHPAEAKSIKVIWQSPLIPSDPVVWRKDLPDELKRRLTDFFLSYARPAPGKSPEQLRHEQELLASTSYAGFRLSSDAQLAPIRRIELFRLRMATEANKVLPDDMKAHRLSEIDQKMRELDAQSPLDP